MKSQNGVTKLRAASLTTSGTVSSVPNTRLAGHMHLVSSTMTPQDAVRSSMPLVPPGQYWDGAECIVDVARQRCAPGFTYDEGTGACE
ncbi:hypothetical protein Asppvi_009937 [Aspergillus pseudoviridinutans]|uniref:Uncharacterized protein n=1 Tax=Aspergillus pseudoviridinutans TaxID=1517512 RepID=A0A9P3BGX7_9EURO|nr:uncharacterized protein Asppvi_009937 [Aspergillus pseudoviridinutans]GIJ90972.1 hypothetical protein Asppvi_009937 [Aspergillus pseudoviridinutans]